MLNLLSQINMSIFGSKLASLSPLMLNTVESVDVAGMAASGLSSLLDIIIDFLVKCVYTVCAFAMNVIDFFQYVINKIIGLGGDYVIFDTSNPLMKFLLNPTVWEVFTYVCGLAIILLIVFTIYAIIRSEYQFATGKAGDNNKTRIFGRSLRSLFALMMFPIILFGSIILLNAVLFGFNNVFVEASGEGTVSLGGQIFAASSYNANRYRNFANRNVRIPLFVDFDDPIQNGTASGYESEELANIYRKFNDLGGGGDLYSMFMHETFPTWNDTIVYKGNKMYNTAEYSKKYDSFVATPDQYYVMADFTDYAVKKGLTYTYKSVKDDDINWKYVDDAVFNEETLTLSITYRDAANISGSESYVMQITPTSTDISTPLQDAIKTISTMLAIGNYEDDTFNILSRNEDFINYIEWDTRKVILRLSPGCQLNSPDTWTVSDSIILYEWSRYDYNNTIPSYVTLEELKEGIEINAQILTKRKYSTTTSKYIVTDEYDVAVINNNFYRIIESKDITVDKNLDEHGFPYYQLLGYDVDNESSDPDVLYERNILSGIQSYINGYINVNTRNPIETTDSVVSFIYNDREYHILKEEFHSLKSGIDLAGYNWDIYGLNEVRRLTSTNGRYYYVGTDVEVTKNKAVKVDGYCYYAPDVIENTKTNIEKGYYIVKGTNEIILMGDAIEIRGTSNLVYCSEESFKDIKVTKLNGTQEYIDPSNGDKYYNFYDDLLSDNIKTVSWPEKLISDLQVIYKDINLELLISNGTWLKKLSELSSNYFASDAGLNPHAAFSSSLIHPLGMVLSELMLGMIEEANPYFDYGDLVFSPKYDQETINGLLLALLGEEKYYQAKQELSALIEIYNAYFMTMLSEIAYTENFDLKVGKEASVQLFTYKAYLASILLSDDCANYFANLALKVVGSNNFIDKITEACPSDCVNKDKDVCNTHRGYTEWNETLTVSGVALDAMKNDLMVMFKDAFDNESFAQFFAYANQYKPEYDINGNPTGTTIIPISQYIFDARRDLILAADSVTSIDDLSTRVGTLKSVQDQLDFFEEDGKYDSEMRKLADERADYLNDPKQFAIRYLINLDPETVGTTDDFIKNIKAYVISDITGSYEEDAAHNIVFKGDYEFLNTVRLDDFATYLEREKVYGGIDAVNNWVTLRKKANDVKKLLDIANTMIKEDSQYSFLDNFNGTFTALRLAFQPIGDFVETQSLSDSLSKYYISYSVKLYFEELTKDTSFTISVRNKQYKVGEHFVKAKLAEYVLGADYLKSIGYDTVFVDSDYKGMIQFEYDYVNNKYTDTVKSSFVYIREFLSEFAQISVDLYTTTNFAPLMVNSVDNVKFVKNPNLANYVVKYINDLELLDISTRIRLDICENSGTFKMIASPEAALNRLQSVMEYLLNTSGSVEHFDYVDYRELSLKELRIKCLNYLEDYKQPEGISGAESQAAYLTTFYLTTANWIVQNGSTANLKNWYTKENGEAKDTIIGLSSKMQNSQSIGTLLRLCGIESRPIEELVGLEYTIDFNYHGVDEQYGDVFVLCTFNPNTRQYLPILATPKANMERFIESDLNPFRTDTEPSGKKVLPAGDEEYLTIMRTNKVDMNGLTLEAEGLQSAYPIIARGVIDEYGCPTAIKIQNGDVHFYREDLYMINTSNFGISQYFVSTEAANESGNPINWIVNTFSRIFTGKSLAEHIISSTPRIRLDSYIGYAIGVQTNTTDVVRNSECHLDYNFNEYIADTIPLHVLYDLNEINIIILICSIGLLFGMLFKAFWGLISRMFNLTLYFLMGPLMISTIAQKYEEKKEEETAVAYDKWKESLISELLSVFSYVFAINLYFILATMVDSFDMFADNSAFAKLPLFSLISVDFLNEIARVVFLLGLAGIFSSLPKIFNSILGVKDIFEQGANTKAAVDNTVAAVQDFASGQEIMDKIDTIKEPFEDIINKRKQKQAAKMAAAAAIIAGADPKSAVEAGKALEDKMKEHAERDKILRHERQYIRDKRNDAIMGTDESEGDAEERRLAHHNYELAPKAKDLRKKMAKDKEDAKKEKKAKAKAEKEGKAYTAPTKYDKQRAELKQELIDIDKNATFGSGLADAVRKKEIREELENIEKQIQKDAKAQAKYVKKNSNKFEKASTQVNTEDLSKTEKKIFKAVEKLKADNKDKK